jgi:ABC-2 type transport system permease protein
MRALGEMAWVELKLFLREPITVVFVLVLPLVTLYVLNGVFGDQPSPEVWQGLSPVDFYTSAYVALVVATVGVLSLPVQLAGYREKGVLRRFRASALPPGVLVTAHGIVAVIMGTVGVTLLVVVSRFGYAATLPQNWPLTLLAFALVTVAFAALGALLGSVMPTARSAQGVGVLVFFVFMMLGGAGPPREVLPDALRLIGDALPLTYAASLLRGPWLGNDVDWTAATVMIGMLAVSAALTWWRLRTASVD